MRSIGKFVRQHSNFETQFYGTTWHFFWFDFGRHQPRRNASDTAKAPSQFYSMMFGIPTFFCGIVALNPHRRKQAMTVATLLCLAAILSGLTWIMIHFSKDFARSAMPSVSPAPPVIAMTFNIHSFYRLQLDRLLKSKKETAV